MRASTGRRRLVTIASISSTMGTAGLFAAYCAAKWGAVGFTKALAEEVRGSGIQAMAVLPGSVDTPMLKVGGFAPQMTPERPSQALVVYAALDAPDRDERERHRVLRPVESGEARSCEARRSCVGRGGDCLADDHRCRGGCVERQRGLLVLHPGVVDAPLRSI